MKRLLFLFAFLGVVWNCHAQIWSPEAVEIPLWDNSTAPHSNALTTPEIEQAPHRPAYIQEARLYLYPADPALNQGEAVVICPGGGYFRLAMDHEGRQMALWFAQQGITAAVLKYRMPNGHPEVPLEDAVKALETMQAQATVWGYNPERVGIAGCSAGGHLAAMCSTMGAIRPAFSVLFYPVITGEEEYCHRGSFDNLLGSDRSDEESRLYWLEERVDHLTPPTILLLSDDDRSVPPINSTRYYNALKEHGIPATMHIYPIGGHGWGIRESFIYRQAWQQAVMDWIKNRSSQ